MRRPSDRPAPPLRMLELPGLAIVVPVGYALSSRDAVHLGQLLATMRAARAANERG